jgi:hypothetical protein
MHSSFRVSLTGALITCCSLPGQLPLLTFGSRYDLFSNPTLSLDKALGFQTASRDHVETHGKCQYRTGDYSLPVDRDAEEGQGVCD